MASTEVAATVETSAAVESTATVKSAAEIEAGAVGEAQSRSVVIRIVVWRVSAIAVIRRGRRCAVRVSAAGWGGPVTQMVGTIVCACLYVAKRWRRALGGESHGRFRGERQQRSGKDVGGGPAGEHPAGRARHCAGSGSNRGPATPTGRS